MTTAPLSRLRLRPRLRLTGRLPAARHLVLLPLSLLMVVPFVYMLGASVMTRAQLNRFPPPLVPPGIDLTGYRGLLTDSQFPRWFLNSVIVAGVIVLSQMLLCSMAGYAFARMRFVGRKVALVLVIATTLIPFQLTVIPTFLIFNKLHLINTLGALIVPQLASALGVYLMTSFFQNFPRELEEAARIDGCSRFGVFFRVVLPVARPALAALAVITFIYAWNDLFWPMVAISSQENYTVQAGLATFQGQHRADWPQIMAGTVLTTVPVLVVFLIGQRRFVQALAGAVKG
ncbi:carbohydrate ABC transporter permease [Actinomadura chibensis]|uniref:Carbohydrate ABC transporter permease n=1 Tax=Actinomadura chibensis TaxID=392828 RepID=A0A5D0N235_9ACTN|nr:carbohydrate ABC transporter permease [Actinomadura chibensis]TYB38388.1 carbohydrate ABC transporter permease [Actinomadura chibensis]